NHRGDRLLSKVVKREDQEVVVPVLEPILRAKVTSAALRFFDALEARDYGRIDLRLDATVTPHFIEANLIPSLLEGYGSFPKACLLNIGMDYETMLLSIVRLGFTRKPALSLELSPQDDLLVPAISL